MTRLEGFVAAAGVACLLIFSDLGAQTASRASYVVTEIPTLGGSFSAVYGISQSGYVVGYSETGRCYHCTSALVVHHDVITELPTLGNPRNNTALAVNARGQVVGSSNSHAFLYWKNVITDLGSLGGQGGSARDINDAGLIVGSAQTSDGEWHAFAYKNGFMEDLGTLGGSSSGAYAVNSAGDIVGASATVPNDSYSGHAFVYKNGEMHDLGTLGGRSSEADGINNKGDVVGHADTAAGMSHGFLYREGEMIDLGPARPHAINDLGEIVGGYYRPPPPDSLGYGDHAFIYRDGGLIDLNSLIPPDSGWVLITAWGVNNAGEIVGNGKLHGEERGFLLTPR